MTLKDLQKKIRIEYSAILIKVMLNDKITEDVVEWIDKAIEEAYAAGSVSASGCEFCRGCDKCET